MSFLRKIFGNSDKNTQQQIIIQGFVRRNERKESFDNKHTRLNKIEVDEPKSNLKKMEGYLVESHSLIIHLLEIVLLIMLSIKLIAEKILAL